MGDLNIEIITPYKVTFNGEAESITIPGTDGSFQVLRNHAPIISTFEIGVIKIVVNKDKIYYFATAGGTVEVNNNVVKVLANSFEAVEAIDIDRAKKALERAKKRIEERHPNTDLARAEEALKRANNRILIVQKYLPRDTTIRS